MKRNNSAIGKNERDGIMTINVVIEYKPSENETFEQTEEIVKSNIENCLGKVLWVEKKIVTTVK